MIKVGIVVNALIFGGVEKVIENYFSDFDKVKYEITIIAQDNSIDEHKEYFKSLGFNIEIIPHKRKKLFKNFLEMKKILKKYKFDIVHSNMSYMNFYVLKFAKKYGTKVRINHYHNVFNFTGMKNKIVRICNKLCEKYATQNFFCSKAVENYFGETYKDTYIIKNAFTLENYEYNSEYRRKIRSEYEINDDEIILGQVGRLTGQKNQMFSLQLLAKLVKYNRKIKFMFVGSGEDKSMLLEKANELNLKENIIWVDAKTNIIPYYSAFDVVILPSVHEGLGIVALEGALSGSPTLISTAFPEEVVLSDNIKRMSLELELWENSFNSLEGLSKQKVNIKPFEDAGYSLFVEKKKLFDLYHEFLGDKS